MPLERPMLEFPALENAPDPAAHPEQMPLVQAPSPEPQPTAPPTPDAESVPMKKTGAPSPKRLTAAGLALTPKTARAAVLYAEILGQPVSRRRRFGKI